MGDTAESIVAMQELFKSLPRPTYILGGGGGGGGGGASIIFS